MTDHRQAKPTKPQLRLLRTLAQERGQTFAYPATADEADREIRRLKRAPRSGRADVMRDRADLRRDLRAKAGGSAAVRPHELEGHGSTAGWAKSSQPLLVVTHTEADGTLVDGTVSGDGAAPVLRRHGFIWSWPIRKWIAPGTPGQRRPDHWRLAGLERDLRLCGFEVELPDD